MIHPTREEWMSYLYDELETAPRRQLEQHLAQCPECSARLTEWQAASRQLDRYVVTPRPRVRQSSPSRLAWPAQVAAAAIVLFAGILIGRATGVSRSDLTALKTEIASLRADTAANTETQKQLIQFNAGLDNRFQVIQAQQATDYATLRKELQTVAVLTEASFRQTQNQIVQLASADTTKSPVTIQQ